ncbi:uncharacterized protein LOC113317286 [Papaver somniferum]|uniref:uncharacterized protein LOC113317286 n=1 Tax=Papaver somniferum TaxID=3469 RepID=UPI000E6FE0DF|nr:uncharacterized protein LOC113317286 [Papaver somniferum]
MYSNFMKSQAFPLVFRVSTRPICLKPSINTHPFSNGFFLNPMEAIKTRKFSSGSVSRTRNSSVIRARGSSSYQRDFNGNNRGRNGGNRTNRVSKLEKASAEVSTRSSWEDAADNFFDKHGGRESVELIAKARTGGNGENRQGRIVIERNEDRVASDGKGEEIGGADFGGDKGRTRYTRVTDRDNGSERRDSGRWNRENGSERRESGRWNRENGSERPAGGRWNREGGSEMRESGRWNRENGSERPAGGRWNREGGSEMRESGRWNRDNGSERPAAGRWNRDNDSAKAEFGRGNRENGSENPEFGRWNNGSWGRNAWKEATESTLPKMVGEGIYGVGPVLAALSAGRREFYTLHVQEGLDLSSNNKKKKDKKGFEKVLKIAEKLGLTVIHTPKHDLNMIVDNRPHQGLVLDASPLEMVRVRELEPVSVEGEKAPLWVALDEVTDPQNLGAIIRSSYFFGAEGVVLCAKNSAPLSGVVSKASAGSLELMELRDCKNMMQFLASSADNGWRVLGGSVSSRAVPLNEVPVGVPTILVLGSEGTGLRPLVERSCTDLIRIPGNIPEDISAADAEDENTEQVDRASSGEEFRSFLAVESLNVSVAAGVLLHHLVGVGNTNSSVANSEVNVLE